MFFCQFLFIYASQVCTTTPDLFVEMGSNFLPELAFNLNPPNLCLLCSWDYSCEPLCPAFNWRSYFLRKWDKKMTFS
jgi:hypothetical protein